jgi:hypothetical protein
LLTWGHRKTFGHLDLVADRLRKDRSPVNLARSVTMYHLIVEGALAQPTQHAIDNALTELDLLPGFREGMKNVSLDEQRHIAFGVRLLADLHAEDPGPVGEAIIEKFREVLPWTTAVAVPPGRDLAYTEPLGIDLHDLFEEGATLIEQRLRAIGLSAGELERFPLPLDLPPRERAARGLRLIAAGYVGERDGPTTSQDPEATEILMDTLRRGAVPEAAPAGTTIQWDFSDAGGRARSRGKARRDAQAELRGLRRRRRRPRGSTAADAAPPDPPTRQAPHAGAAPEGPARLLSRERPDVPPISGTFGRSPLRR